jgi:hypothetical protein
MALIDRVDRNGPPADPAVTKIFATLSAEEGRVTNMKATLLHALPAFEAFSGWKGVKAAVRALVGDHGVSVYSHAISATAGCLLCSTYFRRLLKNEGIDPESWQPVGDDALLADLGAVVGQAQPIGPELKARLKARFDDAAIVNLVAYGATMLATNAFNTALGIPLDDYLEPYRVPAGEVTVIRPSAVAAGSRR